jgi:hypothetical protein
MSFGGFLIVLVIAAIITGSVFAFVYGFKSKGDDEAEAANAAEEAAAANTAEQAAAANAAEEATAANAAEEATAANAAEEAEVVDDGTSQKWLKWFLPIVYVYLTIAGVVFLLLFLIRLMLDSDVLLNEPVFDKFTHSGYHLIVSLLVGVLFPYTVPKTVFYWYKLKPVPWIDDVKYLGM